MVEEDILSSAQGSPRIRAFGKSTNGMRGVLMPELKTGDRLKSTVCDGEVMVVSAPSGDIEITCGGAPMASAADLIQSESKTWAA